MKNLTINILNIQHIHFQLKTSNTTLELNSWMRWKKP